MGEGMNTQESYEMALHDIAIYDPGLVDAIRIHVAAVEAERDAWERTANQRKSAWEKAEAERQAEDRGWRAGREETGEDEHGPVPRWATIEDWRKRGKGR